MFCQINVSSYVMGVHVLFTSSVSFSLLTLLY